MSCICPHCLKPIAPQDVNVSTDVALCRACNTSFALSQLVHQMVVPSSIDLANPPQGTWYRDDGVEVSLGASLRSVGSAVFFILFSTFWNGVTFMGVLASLGLLPTSSNGSGSSPSSTSNAPSILFMLPFILIGLLTALIAVMCLVGKLTITFRGDSGLVSTGVGPIALRRRFNPAEITSVTIDRASWRQNNRPVYQIRLNGTKVRLGSGLTKVRREFIAAALRMQLAPTSRG